MTMAATVPPPRRQPSGRIRAGIARRKVRTLSGIDPALARSVIETNSHDLWGAKGQAGLSWSWLDYRHNFGSHLAPRGISLYKIATQMGNSAEVCRRHSAALVPVTKAEEVEFGSLASQPTALKMTAGQIARARRALGFPLVGLS